MDVAKRESKENDDVEIFDEEFEEEFEINSRDGGVTVEIVVSACGILPTKPKRVRARKQPRLKK